MTKKIMLGFLCWVWVFTLAPVRAVDTTELAQRIRTLAEKFEELQRDSDHAIPAEELRRAHGIVLLDRTKAGLVFAYQGGNGVALVKDVQRQQWGAAAFVSAREVSLGFQVGGQQSFVVVLLMDTNALSRLTQPKISFSGEAGGTAGDVSAGEQASLSKTAGLVRVYADRAGVFGGAAVMGETLKPDSKANRIYYGKAVTMQELLFTPVVAPTGPTADLIQKLVKYSQEKKK